jgi:predicted DNA-binding transcriptional regulator YafY
MIWRLFLITKALRAGELVKATWLSVECRVCEKTIYRDIAFLRTRLGYVIKWEEAQNSYQLINAPDPQL